MCPKSWLTVAIWPACSSSIWRSKVFVAEDDFYGVEAHGFRILGPANPPMRDEAAHERGTHVWATRPSEIGTRRDPVPEVAD